MIDIKKRLEEQIRELEYELKVTLPKEIQRAREYGDLRENAEFKAAKERQSYLDRIPRDKVGLGSTVRLKDMNTGDDVTYDIVTPEEADPAQGKISPSSPIGRCLLNHEEGDTVEVKVPAGTREYEIVQLVTIHDQAGEEAAEEA